jgi:hypothetical protein
MRRERGEQTCKRREEIGEEKVFKTKAAEPSMQLSAFSLLLGGRVLIVHHNRLTAP